MNEFNVTPFNRRRNKISSVFAAFCACLLLSGQVLGGGATVARATGTAGDALTPSAAYDPEPPVSRWGRGDEAGSSNTQTPAKVLQAVKLIKKGKKYPLGHVYEPTMPLFPGNTHALELKTPVSIARQTGNFDFYHGDIGQNGTQFDALGHFGLQPEGDPDFADAFFYNRFRGSEIFSPTGLVHLGVEKIKPFFTRGILLDVMRYANGGATLAPGQEITLEMVRATLAAQGMTEAQITEGDVVLFVTGWEEKWGQGTLAYYAGAPGIPGATPGIGLEVARWLAAKKVACVGADNWGVEVVPNLNSPPGIPFPVHNELLVRNGIPHQESMSLAALAADLAGELAATRSADEARRVYTFAYIYTPVPLKGATGSPGAPLAVR